MAQARRLHAREAEHRDRAHALEEYRRAEHRLVATAATARLFVAGLAPADRARAEGLAAQAQGHLAWLGAQRTKLPAPAAAACAQRELSLAELLAATRHELDDSQYLWRGADGARGNAEADEDDGDEELLAEPDEGDFAFQAASKPARRGRRTHGGMASGTSGDWKAAPSKKGRKRGGLVQLGSGR